MLIAPTKTIYSMRMGTVVGTGLAWVVWLITIQPTRITQQETFISMVGSRPVAELIFHTSDGLSPFP